MKESAIHGHTLTEYGGQLDVAGDYSESAQRFAEAAAVFRRIGDKFGETTALWNQSDVTVALGPGALDQAARLAEEALGAAREVGNADRIALTLCGVAQIDLLQRMPRHARDHLLEALDLVEPIGFMYSLADVLVGFAGVAELLGDPPGGARLLGAATSVLAGLGGERFFHHRMYEHVSARLGGEALRQARTDGAGLTIEAAIAAARAVAAIEPIPGTREDKPNHGLSPRELDVLQLLSDGASNQEIADKLFISRLTVKNHVTGILTKLNVSSRTAAVSYAHRHGLV
jgi:DNA-binding CsgD family transcriptional regulator